MKKYFFLLLLMTSAIAVAITVVKEFVASELVDGITWSLLFYFFFVTFVFHYGLLRSSKGRPQVFIRYYMATTTFKLLLHMGIIVIYALFNKTDAIRFISSFLIFYVLFTAFEVSAAWKQFRKS